jgi:hypothetical protein
MPPKNCGLQLQDRRSLQSQNRGLPMLNRGLPPCPIPDCDSRVKKAMVQTHLWNHYRDSVYFQWGKICHICDPEREFTRDSDMRRHI